MKPLFSVDQFFTTHLSKNQVAEELNDLATQKKYGGLRKDKFMNVISENGFTISRITSGVDGFTFENYPPIEGVYFPGSPLVINIVIKPSYFAIFFFALFVFSFIPAAIFIDKMTFNGIYKTPDFFERLIFAGVGGVMPGLWCYFGYIRPVKKAKKWIIEKLSLSPTDYYNG